jgi:hypothetical protein
MSSVGGSQLLFTVQWYDEAVMFCEWGQNHPGLFHYAILAFSWKN